MTKSACKLNASLRAFASSPEGTPTHLSLSKDNAKVVVKAVDRLSEENSADLLSHGEDEMVFLAKAVLDNPKTAYAIIKNNHALILEARTASNVITSRLVRGLSEKALKAKLAKLCKVVKFPCTAKDIKIMRVHNGQSVAIPFKSGTPYNAVSALRAELSKCYVIRGNVDLRGAGNDIAAHFVVTGVK